MDKRTGETNPADNKVKLEKKYIRVQELGIALLVAIPFAVLLLGLFGLYTALTVMATVFFMGAGGFGCLQLGEEKRNALRVSNDNTELHKGGDSNANTN